MPICTTCSGTESDLPVPRAPGYEFVQGDIHRVYESVYTPIYDILRHPSSNLAGTALRRSQLSFFGITNTDDVVINPRPAIIMENQKDDRRGILVCLGTTYDKQPLWTMPRIFQHFSVRVSPHDDIFQYFSKPDTAHDGILPDDLSHLHSLPEMDE